MVMCFGVDNNLDTLWMIKYVYYSESSFLDDLGK